MKTRILFPKMALCGLLILMAVGPANSAGAPVAIVRGRLVHKNGAPAAGLSVTISDKGGARSAPAHTGSDGMYYLSNICTGKDFLEIWTSKSGKPLVYQIKVTAPSTDVPQIAVP
jgi:hypothetical protein